MNARGILLTVLLAGCGAAPPPDSAFSVIDLASSDDTPEGRCYHYTPSRMALFGDLHIHSMLSSDAYSFGVRVTPDDAYRYAFGGSLTLPGPAGAEREVSNARPLDFAAVTDHAEFLGEMRLCTDPASSVYDEDFCHLLREGTGREPGLIARIMAPVSLRDGGVCGDDNQRCNRASASAWEDTVAAAERWNDTSADCTRTTFPAYEYSSFRLGSNLHRNVIFRNASVPAQPISYLEAIREWGLWALLKTHCIDGSDACDVLAIPHNANISNGRMFAIDYPGADGPAERAARARLRAELEPVAEIMQHKGASECHNGVPGVLAARDELCDFENFENFAMARGRADYTAKACGDGLLADWTPHLGPDCLSPLNYLRYTLIEGLNQSRELGVNPFKLGLIGSTDTHNGLGGGVGEKDYPGHLGLGDATALQRVQYSTNIAGNTSNNPGGLVGVWAEENRRNAIFDGLKRREVFGTSGPRIQPRFFAGWNLPEDICSQPAPVEAAYRNGVPMGGELAGASGVDAPRFLAAATADPESQPLQQLQVIKGWIDVEGVQRSRVYTVAGDPNNGAGVVPNTCAPTGTGAAQLCATWQDPDFKADEPAFYYLRAVENPSCRYSAWQCLALPEAERPVDCSAPPVPPVIQERAWSSPIWYQPRG